MTTMRSTLTITPFKLTLTRYFNPTNAEATFGQSTRTQSFLKNICTLSCWYSLEALSEYSQMNTHMPGFQSYFIFFHHFILAKLATSSIRVKSNANTCSLLLRSPNKYFTRTLWFNFGLYTSKIRHDIRIQCQWNYMEMKEIQLYAFD